ncbi:MAG: 3-deoxy-D-manno-octulosonic acid transferase [bacterium]|nr:3-deoxy-D-manno-octulosonic acid transferase [bacterium]
MSPRPSSFFWRILYNFLAVPLLFIGFQLAAFLSRAGVARFDKIRLGRLGRRNLFENLARQLERQKNSGPRFWIHASSMGEYEQARPLLQEIKQRFPGAVRILTFFSPSAYANINHANIPAEVVSYLPFDSWRNARRFMNLAKPAGALIIRHDFWPNHLWAAKQCGVAVLLVNASVSANARSWRHRPLVRHFNRAVFDTFDAICAVSPAAAASLTPLIRSPERLTITGDSRHDQVLFRAQSKKLDEVLPENWRDGSPMFVAGSTWPSDEEVLLPAFVAVRQLLPSLRLILVPHEPTPAHLAQLETQLADLNLLSVRLSQLTAKENKRPDFLPVLLVDRIGILASLYSAGQVAFVGGSFGPGVHSILEAAVHGVPVLVGPRFHNSPEAVELYAQKILTAVADARACEQALLALWQNAAHRQKQGEQHRAFVLARCGASAKMIDLLAGAIAKKQEERKT